MDFRMEKISWAMLVFMLGTMCYYVLAGSGTSLTMVQFLQVLAYGLLALTVLVAVCCIPVIIYCYFVKKIPDIDYSIYLAFIVTLIGIISELF